MLTSLLSFCASTGTTSKSNTSTNNVPDEESSHKNIVSVNQEHPSISSPTGHYSGPADRMQSPLGPALGRSQENPSGLGTTENLTESSKQQVDGQGQSAGLFPAQPNSAVTVSTNSTDPAPPNPPQHKPSSPHQNAPSPALLPQNLPPVHVTASPNSTQQISESNLRHTQNAQQLSEHKQNIQKHERPQASGTPPQSLPQSSPQPMTQNTQQHNAVLPSHQVTQSISPQCPTQSLRGTPQSSTQGTQPGPPHPAPLTSLPPSHPTPLLPSQPSPADHGNQRPSEPTSRPDTEGTAISPKPTMMTPGPPNSNHKHQAFSPNPHQTQLMGSNLGMQAQRGTPNGHSPAMPPNSQGQVNGAMGPYGMGNPPHPHYNQTNMTRPMHPSAHHPYHNQAMNALHGPAPHPNYHQQGGTPYAYHMQAQQHPQAHNNMYPPHQYQQQTYFSQPHPQAQVHTQANGRGGYPPEEWHRSHYHPRQPMPPNSYLTVNSGRASSQSKESSMSPLGSEGSSRTSLVSPGPVPEAGPQPGGTDKGSSGSPVTQAHNESSEQPESPKEILDLDSHNAAARRRSTQPVQQHPPSAGHMASAFMYDPRALHPGMQPGGIPPPHMMSQSVGNRTPYPGQPYPDQGRYGAQRPHPHLMEALQRPQQLPFSPGQTRMAMYRHPRPGGHFQGMMMQQRGLVPERFLHPG